MTTESFPKAEETPILNTGLGLDQEKRNSLIAILSPTEVISQENVSLGNGLQNSTLEVSEVSEPQFPKVSPLSSNIESSPNSDEPLPLKNDTPISPDDITVKTSAQLPESSLLVSDNEVVAKSEELSPSKESTPPESFTPKQSTVNFLNTKYAKEASEKITLDSKTKIQTLENSYLNFKRGTTSGRTYDRVEATLKRYGFNSKVTLPWFKFFQKLERNFKPVDTRTLIIILFYQDPLKEPELSMDFPEISAKDMRDLVTKVTKAFGFFDSKKLESQSTFHAQRALFSRIDIDASVLLSWFEGFQLLLKTLPEAELVTLIKVFLSQVWQRVLKTTPKDSDLLSLASVPIVPPSLMVVQTPNVPSSTDSSQLPNAAHCTDPNQPCISPFGTKTRPLSPSGATPQSISPQFDWNGEVSDEDPSLEALEFILPQDLPCNTPKYVKFPRCRSCVAKKTDICRFKYVRLFAENSSGSLVVGHRFLKPEGISLLGENKPLVFRPGKKRQIISEADRFEAPQLPLAPLVHKTPTELEVRDNAFYTMSCIAPTLVKILEAEVDHLENNAGRLSYRRPTPLMGQTCDACSTGIFSCFWMCRTCGKELCLLCYHHWGEERSLRFGMLESCVFRKLHKRNQFVPVTNYLPNTIYSLLSSVTEFMNKNTCPPALLPLNQSLFFQPDYPSLPFPYCEPSEIGVKDFQACWQRGQPMVLKSAPGESKYPCGPDHLMEHYGKVQTEILKPGGESLGLRSVGDFFRHFDDPEKGQLNMKIKDWPSKGNFSDYFPHLNRDFINQLPFPESMSYTGSLNLVSLLPSDSHKIPDLGPKMYAAYAGSSGSEIGTTQLHLDAADAINILKHSGGPNGEPGAIWDLFRREDADGLRDYIRFKFGQIYAISDPIHDQAFYLSDEILEDIYLCKGIRSYRVFQKQNEVVLVPAGCPHQVRNLHPCVKLAMDFVAPEGVASCLLLASQFRMLPPSHRRGVDILGTSTLLARSWATCMERLGLSSPFDNDDVAPLIFSKKKRDFETPLKSKRVRLASEDSEFTI